jgi:hypothetical protein
MRVLSNNGMQRTRAADAVRRNEEEMTDAI